MTATTPNPVTYVEESWTRTPYTQNSTISGAAGVLHSTDKNQVMMMFKAAASHSGSNISLVGGEETGIIAARSIRRPGDVTFRKKQILYAIDYEAIRGFMPSYVHTPHGDLMTNKEEEKQGKYYKDCLDNETTFMPFVMDVMGSLGPSAIEIIRIASNGVSGSNDDRMKFRKYKTRHIVVAVRKEHLIIIISRQRQRSPGFSSAFELASSTLWDDSVSPGVMLADHANLSYFTSKEKIQRGVSSSCCYDPDDFGNVFGSEC